MSATPSSSPVSATSLTDILTAIKNLVTALSTASTNYLNVQGQANLCNISTATVVKSSAGRIATVVVLAAGSSPGYVYDGTAVTAATTKVLYPIPNEEGLYVVNMPAAFGIVVAPSAGQIVTVSYS